MIKTPKSKRHQAFLHWKSKKYPEIISKEIVLEYLSNLESYLRKGRKTLYDFEKSFIVVKCAAELSVLYGYELTPEQYGHFERYKVTCPYCRTKAELLSPDTAGNKDYVYYCPSCGAEEATVPDTVVPANKWSFAKIVRTTRRDDSAETSNFKKPEHLSEKSVKVTRTDASDAEPAASRKPLTISEMPSDEMTPVDTKEPAKASGFPVKEAKPEPAITEESEKVFKPVAEEDIPVVMDTLVKASNLPAKEITPKPAEAKEPEKMPESKKEELPQAENLDDLKYELMYGDADAALNALESGLTTEAHDEPEPEEDETEDEDELESEEDEAKDEDELESKEDEAEDEGCQQLDLFSCMGAVSDYSEKPCSGSVSVSSLGQIKDEDVDTVLALGCGNEKCRINTTLLFEKGLTPEGAAEFLPEVYYGGAGWKFPMYDLSVWYGKEGVKLSTSKNGARYNKSALVISWEDAAKRIKNLLEQGRYALKEEVENAELFERNRLAEDLLFLKREIEKPGYLSCLSGTSLSFTDAKKEVSERLLNDEVKKQLFEEMNRLIEDSSKEPDTLRGFGKYYCNRVLKDMKLIFLKHTPFTLYREKIPDNSYFVTDDVIRESLERGSNISEWEKRVGEFFDKNKDNAKRANFLKNEFGTGGFCPTCSGCSIGYNAKGYSVSFGFDMKTERFLKWTEVSRYLAEVFNKSLNIKSF